MSDLSWLEETPEGVRLELLIQPRASKSEVIGPHDGRMKIRIKAPPVDGEANKELISFLAKHLHLPRAAIRIVSGETGRRKTVELHGIDAACARQLLAG